MKKNMFDLIGVHGFSVALFVGSVLSFSPSKAETWTMDLADELKALAGCPSPHECVVCHAGRKLASSTSELPSALSDRRIHEGLCPSTEYTFYAYARGVSDTPGCFTVGGQVYTADATWFNRLHGDYVMFTATADETGAIEGTFSGTSEEAAVFCGLQVIGGAFPEYIPRATIILVR